MIETERAAGVGGLVEGHQHVDISPWIDGEVIPFVRPDPPFGQHAGRRIHAVGYLDGGLLNGGMTHEVGPHESTVPWPIVQGISGRVNADVSTTGPDVT